MTVLFGGTGFIGRHLAARLSCAGQPVTAFSRRGAEKSCLTALRGVDVVEMAVDDKVRNVQLREAIRNADVIYNLAGTSGAVASNQDPRTSLEGNCKFQLEILRACEEAGNRPHVVFSSSRLVYGRAQVLPVSETSPVIPTSFYAAHKVCVENYHEIQAHRGTITYSICRISNPFAFYRPEPNQSYGFINRLIYQGANGQPLSIYGEGSQVRDFLHIDDLIDALELCGTHIQARNETFNIGSGQPVAMNAVAQLVHEITGVPVIYSSWPAEDALVESGDFVMDIGKARTRLDYHPKFEVFSALRQMLESGRLPTSAFHSMSDRREDAFPVLRPKAAAAGHQSESRNG